MSPSYRPALRALSAAAVSLSLIWPAFASIDRAGGMVFATGAAKYCSGAFRYAARVGNSDVFPLSPSQVFANDRRFYRTRAAARPTDGLRSPLLALNVMCG